MCFHDLYNLTVLLNHCTSMCSQRHLRVLAVRCGLNTHSRALEHTGILLGIDASSSHQLLVDLGDRKIGTENTRSERKSTELCLLLQTPPAEAHWLVALAPPSLIGCGLARPSAAQPDRRGGRHHNRKSAAAVTRHTWRLNASHAGIKHKNYFPCFLTGTSTTITHWFEWSV